MRSFPGSNSILFTVVCALGQSGIIPWGGTGTSGVGGLMAYAMNWWIEKCNDPHVGYHMDYREEQTINGITYYDCSSFVYYGLLHSGFQLTPGGAFTTWSMGTVLKNLGFKELLISGGFDYHVGDILVTNSGHHHTEIVHDVENGGHTMGAHGRDNRALPDQVSINTYTIAQGVQYTHCYRWLYSGGDFKIGNNEEYFGDPEKELCGGDERAINNAIAIYNYWKAQGWTTQAICGFLGNVQQESVFNPALIEHGGTGHGFVQWTPPTDLYKVLDVLYGKHDDWYDPIKQLSVILAEFQQSSGIKNWGIEPQWYSTSTYPMTWREWTQSIVDTGVLALVWQANYERPASLHQERATWARAWYKYIKDNIEKS